MIAAHSIRRAFFSCAVLVPIAALAAETSAQSRSTPERHLSDAIAEVLGSPFHDASAPATLRGAVLLLPPIASSSAKRGGRTTSRPTGLPGAGVLPVQEASSPNRPVGPTVFGAVATHLATVLFLRCQHYDRRDPGRYTGRGRPGVVIGFPPAEDASLCQFFDVDNGLVEAGLAALVPTLTTAGGATLGGSRFLKAVGASALGYLGSFVFYGGMTSVLDEEDPRDLPILTWFLGGLMHGIATAYLSG